mgnify:CR=1 FL=1
MRVIFIPIFKKGGKHGSIKSAEKTGNSKHGNKL